MHHSIISGYPKKHRCGNSTPPCQSVIVNNNCSCSPDADVVIKKVEVKPSTLIIKAREVIIENEDCEDDNDGDNGNGNGNGNGKPKI